MVDPAHKKRRANKAGPSAPKDNQAALEVPPAPASSRLFAPFRALGYVCNHVPFAMFVHKPSGALATPTISIVTSVGRSWLMWDAASMRLLFVGSDAGATITSLVVTGKEVYAAAGTRVTRYVRGKPTGQYEAAEPIGKIIIFGEQMLGLREDGKGMYIWTLKTLALENEITFHTSFIGTQLLHPATYLNKVLIASSTGELQLWNTRSCSLIHSYSSPVSSPVTALAQSPAIDVIAVGHQDGTIRVHDVRLDESVMQFSQNDAITALSFRMDGPAILASASRDGTIGIWDLTKRRIAHIQRGAHDRGLAGLEWVSGQPLLITSSEDNYVKQWLFDSPDSLPRLLKFRGGHFAPPAVIRYHGEDGKQILTAGRDRSLRYTSVVRDSRSFELSQGSIVRQAHKLGVDQANLKLPQITALASSSTRSKDWDDVLSAHGGDRIARTWRVKDKRLGAHALEAERGAVQAVCISACGNFGFAGSSEGDVRMWNMQSGKERRRFALSGEVMGDSKPKIMANGRRKKAAGLAPVTTPITGLETDSLNTTLIVATILGQLYFFDFHNTKLVATLSLDSGISGTILLRSSNLLMCICDDLALRLVDIEARRVVREFRGFRGRILDACFSPDGRWVLATSLDGCVRTYDIPTGRLVDIFRTESVATSLSFSPTGDFLATAHVDSLGVHLWANRAQFLDIPLRHISEDAEVPSLSLPTILGDTVLEGVEAVGEPEYTGQYATPEQLADELVTLSLIPRSRWQTLLNLDTIKARNKPKEPPKAPEKAPFFLPTVQGLETRFDLSAAPAETTNGKRLDLGSSGGFMESEFTRRLTTENIDGDYDDFFTYIKALPPSATDLEIRSLLSLAHLAAFLRALTQRLRSRRDYEAVQVYLAVFLRVHGDVLVANAELGDALRELREEQGREGERVRRLVGYALGTIGFMRGAG